MSSPLSSTNRRHKGISCGHTPPKQAVWTPRSHRLLQTVAKEHRSRLALFQKVYEGRSEAIKAFCLTCQGFDETGIRERGDRCCPLWHFRPFRRKQTP